MLLNWYILESALTSKVLILFLKMSIELHGSLAHEPSVLINTTVQEKNITYPTDAKLAIKISNRLNKLAKHHNIQQRRTYVKEVKNCRFIGNGSKSC
jgi:IS5 family transposase